MLAEKRKNKMRRIIPCLFLLLVVSQSVFAKTYINGRETGSIEREKILKAQERTITLVEDQIAQLKVSNSFLKEDLTQQIRTIQLLHSQIDELKKANNLKQAELDSHKYDNWFTFLWIVVTAIVTTILNRLFDCLFKKNRVKKSANMALNADG